ncbi:MULTISPECIES: hypothetical protein [unclassified Streptomyces]|uniref:hypothetical protein n=1 Tax=Streptomyces sp. NPDC127532 TaxID=3345399 RepID=UPI00363270B4
MRRSRQDKNHDLEVAAAAAWPYGPGAYMWNALARLRSTHRDPVVGLKPFILPAGVLSFVQAPDVILASRIQLTGTQTTSDLHDMISTATRGISWDARTLGPVVALDITVGRRHDLVLREAEGRLSATLEGTVRCVRNRALYERLDRLEAVPAPEGVAPGGG